MACNDKINRTVFLEKFSEKSWEWDFFQIVRKLQMKYCKYPAVGDSSHIHADIIRFKQNISLKFYATDIAECNVNKNKIEITTNFLGLFGANGPMPQIFTEYIYQQIRNNKNIALAEFFDMFHHRMISFFYKSWALSRQQLSYEKGGGKDHFKGYFRSLIGHNYTQNNPKSSLSEDAILYYSGHFLNNTGTVEKLVSVISSYFNVEVKIEEYIKNRINIESDKKFNLGKSKSSGLLGDNIILGAITFECSCKFRLILGPMNLKTYLKLLPGSNGFKQLIEWIKYFAPPHLKYDIKFILKENDAPKMRNGLQLGYSTWLLNESPNGNLDDLIIENPEDI
jgi:type VI secretion system protein ImpH